MKTYKSIGLVVLIVVLLVACTLHTWSHYYLKSSDMNSASESGYLSSINWGDISTDLYHNRGVNITIKAQFLNHGEISTSDVLDVKESEYWSNLQKLLPQNPPDKLDFNQPGIVLTVTDSGEEYTYITMSDNKIFTIQQDKIYYLGESNLQLSFQKQLDNLILTVKEKQPKLISLPFPIDNKMSFDNKNTSSISISQDAKIFMCLWDWKEDLQFVSIKNSNYIKNAIESLNSLTEIKSFEYTTGGMILYLIIIDDEKPQYYMFRGPYELFDYQNNVIWDTPDTLFNFFLFVYAQGLVEEV